MRGYASSLPASILPRHPMSAAAPTLKGAYPLPIRSITSPTLPAGYVLSFTVAKLLLATLELHALRERGDIDCSDLHAARGEMVQAVATWRHVASIT